MPESENLTQREAARRLGVSASTLRRASDRVTRNEDGTYPWPQVQREWTGAENLTQIAAAARIGVDPRHLRRLTKEGVVSRNGDGTYPFPIVEEEYAAHRAEHEAERAAGFGDEDYERARAKKTAAQAEIAELTAKKMRGELIDRRDVAALVRAPLEEVDRVLKTSPRRHAKKWARILRIKEAQALELLEAFVEEIRGDLRGLADVA